MTSTETPPADPTADGPSPPPPCTPAPATSVRCHAQPAAERHLRRVRRRSSRCSRSSPTACSLSPGNITNIVLQYSYILVLAIGMVIVIIGGHIDLSVGSVVALTGAVSAVLVIQQGYPWWVGILAALVVGVAVGAWQGFWVAYVGIPAFIVTLAGMLLFRGLTLQVLDNISLSPFPRRVPAGRGRLPQRPARRATASTRSRC